MSIFVPNVGWLMLYASDLGMAAAPALRDYILVITIPVGFLEATAHQLRPMQPSVVMGFSGVCRVNGPPEDS